MQKTLEPIEIKYFDQLAQTTFLQQNKSFKISVERARQLIDDVNADMEKDINDYFVRVRGKANEVKISAGGNLTKQGIQAKEILGNPKVRAFLEVIKYGEAYKRVLGNGLPMQYDEASNFKKMPDYKDHPGKTLPGGSTSASGAYQIMTGTWFGEKGIDIGIKKKLGLTDFTPESQDIAAAFLMQNRNIPDLLYADRFADAIQNGSGEWACFPDKAKGDPEKNPKSHYSGQPAAPLSWLEDKYNKALGK